ncbi:MAG: cupin domain-containing protein [Spirochaetes bacterium]|nr:cupin domain-containing protein [Spirochaetota bacterium]
MEKINEFELNYRNGASGVKYFFRGEYYEWGKILLKSGEKLDEHYHAEVEETFHLLSGEAILMVNGNPVEMKEGDVIKLSAKERHTLVNHAQNDALVLFIKAPYNPDDKVMVDKAVY